MPSSHDIHHTFHEFLLHIHGNPLYIYTFQASPPSPRRGLKNRNRKQRGISLRRDPSRLGELFARSKIMSWPPGRPLAKKAWVSLCQTRLGKSDSPGRDYQLSPWPHLQQMYHSTQPITQSISRTKNNDYSIQTIRKLKNKHKNTT